MFPSLPDVFMQWKHCKEWKGEGEEGHVPGGARSISRRRRRRRSRCMGGKKGGKESPHGPRRRSNLYIYFPDMPPPPPPLRSFSPRANMRRREGEKGGGRKQVFSYIFMSVAARRAGWEKGGKILSLLLFFNLVFLPLSTPIRFGAQICGKSSVERGVSSPLREKKGVGGSIGRRERVAAITFAPVIPPNSLLLR